METSLTIDPSREVSHKDIGTFLAEYASWLLGCGATCIRIEKNTRRMAEALGVALDLSIMPAHVTITVWRHSDENAYTTVRKTAPAGGISFDLNARLSRLSWEVADNHLDLHQARQRFNEIKLTRPTNAIEVLLLASVANAAFCHIFGGDLVAMVIVFLSTLAGYRVKQLMLVHKRDVRLTFLVSSFFAASLSAAGCIFELGTTPDIALGTSVLFLVPGVPYINAVSDMLDRHYLCALWRLTDAIILTACLSAGLCAGMLILGLNW